MREFQSNYAKLNASQKQAVDTIDGPLVVVAGPGTGKTQLLSMRVANILRQPNNSPDQILCLTFTDNAARNMQDRLVSIVGRPAYHVAIHTFHSFSDRIINNYPDYFVDRALLRPIDELGQFQLLREIFDDLPHHNPLATKVGDDYLFLKDSQRSISWLKQAGLSPTEYKQILNENKRFFAKVEKKLADTFSATPSAKLLNKYASTVELLSKEAGNKPPGNTLSYAELAARELAAAIEASDTGGRYVPPITAWRKKWLEKDTHGSYRLKDQLQLPKLEALAEVYGRLQETMRLGGLYDFDDMLLEVVHALEQSPELALNISERYQYVLVDEFQDTNQAQLRLLWALGDVTPNERRPNMMVVGDPNQAIYAFQGAFNTSFQQFNDRYESVKLVNLTDNYRSTESILEASYEVIRQSPEESRFLNREQLVLAAHASHRQDIIEHDVLASELAHYQWVADRTKEYIENGHSPSDIAIIAPRHRYLERLVPYLAANDLPIAYERRENILDAPLIQELLMMVELVHAINNNRQDDIDYYLGKVLGFEFWQIDPEQLMAFSVECYEQNCHWLPGLMSSDNRRLKRIAEWFYSLGRTASTEPLEYILDELGGGRPTTLQTPDNDDGIFRSPFNNYYFGRKELDSNTEDYLNHLGQLTALRQRLRSWQPDKFLRLNDLVEFVKLHQQAGVNILSTNPHTQAARAVQLMTAYKAKGLEFDIVFVINSQDEVWGTGARDRVDRIRLPCNLPIKPAGDTEADKLRLFFVALTRAKHTLHIVSYTHNLDDKLSLGLGFIGGNTPESQPVHQAFQPQFIDRQAGSEAVRLLSTAWAYRYRQIIADKPTLFGPILEDYRLSATHLNNFLNVIDAGPEYFIRHNLLHFPEAMSPAAAYGDAIHQTLKMITSHFTAHQNLPADKTINGFFEDILRGKHLRTTDYRRYLKRGKQTLKKFVAERRESLVYDTIAERNFANEGVVVGEARLSGKIDAMRLKDNATLELIDYKTGKPSRDWEGVSEFEKTKLHRYKQQLYFYKLLVDNSASFGNRYKVTRGGVEYVEPDAKSKRLRDTLFTEFDGAETMRLAELIQAVWRCVQSLDIPDISGYSRDLNGIKQFEHDLIERYSKRKTVP